MLPQEPGLDPEKDVRGNVEDGVRYLRDLLDRFNEISGEFANPDADFDALLAEQAKVQDLIDAARRLGASTARSTSAMDALRCPPADQDVEHALGRREAARRALPAAALRSPTCCCSTSRRTTSTPSRSPGSSSSSSDYPGTVVAITHDRYFLDNVAGWILELDRGKGIPWEGNYSSLARPEAGAAGARGEDGSARQRTLERELEWVRMLAEGPPGQVARRASSAYEKLLAEEQNVEARGRSRSTSRPGRASATSSSRRKGSRRPSATGS